MQKFEDDPRLQRVKAAQGQGARDHLIKVAKAGNWHLTCAGTVVPHIQFRRHEGETPYPYALILNAVTPTFYVRRPESDEVRQQLLEEFHGAHLNAANEVKIPVRTRPEAKKVAARFFP